MPTPNNNSNAYQKRVAGNGGYLHDWDEHDTENYPPTRDEYVTRPTSEELAADKSYMNTPWQKPVGDVADVNNGGVAPENNLPKPKATPMGVGGDGRYANTDAKTGTAALNNLFGDSWALTPEQEQARLRRMHTSSMIGNLGNVMSAFANLYYAGKGAPSQKVPDAVVPDYMSFVDRVNQARRNAATQQLALEKLKADREGKNRELQMKQIELDMKKPVYDAQARSYDALVEQRQAAAAYNEARIAISQGNYELAKQKMEEAERHNRAVEAIQGMNASTNSAREGRLAGGYTQEETNNGLSKVVTRTYNTNQGGSSQKPSSVNASQQQKPKTNTSSEKKALGVKWVK